MAHKKSYRSNIIGFAFLGIALLIFFVGPKFIETNNTRDIDSTLDYVHKAKAPKAFKDVVIAQLTSDRVFAQQNGNPVEFGGVKLPAVYWLSLLVIVLGFGIPLVMKYFENKRVKPEGA